MKIVAAVIGVTALIFVLALIGAYPTMWVVNYLFTSTVLTTVFGGALTFWKAFWLNFLCGWLVKSTCTHTCEK